MKAKTTSTAPAPRRQILILDDHPTTRIGIARLLEQEPDLACCGEAGTAEEALAMVKQRKPDLVLADITLPKGHGLEFIKDLRAIHPEIVVLVVSMHDEMIYAERALSAGARGYLMKSAGGAKLVEAIRQVLAGKVYVSENMSGKILDNYLGRRRDHSMMGKLTDREFEIFCLLGQGMTNREIGQRLHLSAKTVETHRLHVRDKLQIKTGPALIKHAMRWASSRNMLD